MAAAANNPETICAIATPAGRGGISIIRVSGPLSSSVALQLTGVTLSPRYAHYGAFADTHGNTLDTGIALFFPGPDSFTGEDVVEFQAHGGPFVIDRLLQEILSLGPRLARPGEFTERAFLNDKIDLAQAEAIADLINSNSAEAARFAMRSLQGEFSELINALINAIIELRMYVEAAIDFPEEEVDFLANGEVETKLNAIVMRLDQVLAQATQGSIMNEGIRVVIAGEPNAGKSSLLNRLAGQSRAIVTDIAGTTRDTLKELVNIDGLPLHIIDTAGLHQSEDVVELEGIRRAWQEIRDADLVLLLVDSTTCRDPAADSLWQEIHAHTDQPDKVILVRNKIDLLAKDILESAPGDPSAPTHTVVSLSAKTGDGIDQLKTVLKQRAGFKTTEEGGFIARRRHLDALVQSRVSLLAGLEQLTAHHAGELVAEDLRNAHLALEIITGRYTPDDLLGEIFSSFCIGK